MRKGTEFQKQNSQIFLPLKAFKHTALSPPALSLSIFKTSRQFYLFLLLSLRPSKQIDRPLPREYALYSYFSTRLPIKAKKPSNSSSLKGSASFMVKFCKKYIENVSLKL